VLDGGRLTLVPCEGAVELAAGRHLLEVTNVSGFAVSELVLLPRGRRTDAASPGGTAVVDRWGSVDRRVAVSSPVDSLLVVTESFNRGWEARLDDQPLEPVLVDGWKQGFRVPAGADGSVALSFAPQRLFVTGLAVGAGLAGVLVAASVLLWRRRAAPPRERDRGALARGVARARTAAAGAPVVVAAVVVLALVSVPLALGAAAGAWLARLPHQVARAAVVVGLGALPAAAALTVLLADSPLAPPVAAELLTAYAVGLAAAVALAGPPAARTEEERA
jgi:arabinofuranan 3-O-arabinosyltransferase